MRGFLIVGTTYKAHQFLEGSLALRFRISWNHNPIHPSSIEPEKMPKPDEETEAMRKELASLVEKCREEQKKVCDTQDFGPISSIPKSKATTRKQLKGKIHHPPFHFLIVLFSLVKR